MIEAAGDGRQDSRGHLARAEADEQAALNNSELSDEESADRVAVSLRNREIYGARVANREKALTAFSAELLAALNAAHQELRGLIYKRLTGAGKLLASGCWALDARDQPGLAPTLADLIDFSLPIERIRALEPSPVIPGLGNNEVLVQAAKSALVSFEQVTAEAAAKKI